MIRLDQLAILFSVLVANTIYNTIRGVTKNKQTNISKLFATLSIVVMLGELLPMMCIVFGYNNIPQEISVFNIMSAFVPMVISSALGIGHMFGSSARQGIPNSYNFWRYYIIDQVTSFVITVCTCVYVYFAVLFVWNNPTILYICLISGSVVFSIVSLFFQIFLTPYIYYQPTIGRILSPFNKNSRQPFNNTNRTVYSNLK